MKVYIVNEITFIHHYERETTSIGAFTSIDKVYDAIHHQIEAIYGDDTPVTKWELSEDRPNNEFEYIGYVWVCDNEFIITRYEVWKVDLDKPLWQN